MKRSAVLSVAAVALFLGCAGAPGLQEGGAPVTQEGGTAAVKGGSVPVSALPEPGQCRIWSPMKGEHGPSGPCAEVTPKVKSGDWMLSRGMKNSGDVQVFVYGELGAILETYLLDAATGKRK